MAQKRSAASSHAARAAGSSGAVALWSKYGTGGGGNRGESGPCYPASRVLPSLEIAWPRSLTRRGRHPLQAHLPPLISRRWHRAASIHVPSLSTAETSDRDRPTQPRCGARPRLLPHTRLFAWMRPNPEPSYRPVQKIQAGQPSSLQSDSRKQGGHRLHTLSRPGVSTTSLAGPRCRSGRIATTAGSA